MAPPNFLDEEKTPYCIPAKPLNGDVSQEIASSKGSVGLFGGKEFRKIRN